MEVWKFTNRVFKKVFAYNAHNNPKANMGMTS